MCFYHSVAIKIETDFSEVLALNQIANIFPKEDPLVHKKVNQIVFASGKY